MKKTELKRCASECNLRCQKSGAVSVRVCGTAVRRCPEGMDLGCSHQRTYNILHSVLRVSRLPVHADRTAYGQPLHTRSSELVIDKEEQPNERCLRRQRSGPHHD